MPATSSSHDSITGRDVMPSSAGSYEFKPREVSSASIQTVGTPLDIPAEAQSSSISQTYFRKQSPISKQFAASNIPQLSSSPKSSLNSSSQKSSSISSNGSSDRHVQNDEYSEDKGEL